MKKLIIVESARGPLMLATAAWSQATMPARQTIGCFTTPLERRAV